MNPLNGFVVKTAEAEKQRESNLPGHTLTEGGGRASWFNLRREEEPFSHQKCTKAVNV